MAHTTEVSPGFCSIKQLEVSLLPPGWDTSLSQGYPQQLSRRYPFIHLGGARHYESNAVPRPGLEPRPFHPESSALTIRPLRLTQKNVG